MFTDVDIMGNDLPLEPISSGLLALLYWHLLELTA